MGEKKYMETKVQLPSWLDKYIFDELGAKYCRSNSDMTVIDWDKSQVLNYLGTYFPRSYAESFCIYKAFFENDKTFFSQKESISIFDFGCGTGGEIIGLLLVLNSFFPNIKQVNIVALDGNHDELRLYEKVLAKLTGQITMNIHNKLAPVKIDDFYDLGIIDEILNVNFDIIMSFKAICEFVTKDCFERHNAYKHISIKFLPKLRDGGIMLLVDVSSYNNVSKEWLPKMMDEGLHETDCKIVAKNEGFNQTFFVSHSHMNNDISKIIWRIIINN